MRLQPVHAHAHHARIGLPAAVLGTLAGALTASPAAAAPPPSTTAAERMIEQRFPTRARPVPTSTTPATYTVRSGDTVSSIAESFGLRIVDVLSWNGLGWRSVIYPGQSLRLVSGTPTPAPATPATPSAPGASHTVVAGDTIFGIAQRYATTVDAVLAANGLTRSSVIYPGQTITVGGASTTAAASPSTPAPPTTTPATTTSATTHTVTAGDTVFGIAQRHGTTVAAVLAANGLSASSIIYPGQTIIVSAPAPAPAAAAATSSAALDAEQIDNVRLIIRIGRELGVSDRGIAIALATAMVESWIRNLDWGDRDSLGLFQQRPSTGWGTPEQIRDRERSIRVFFGGPADPNGAATRGLLDVSSWESMSFSDAAQAVQISAYPERYSQWETQAHQWIALYG